MADRVFPPLPTAREDRVAVADGVMGAVPGSVAPVPEDFAGHEGRDEVPCAVGANAVRACPESGADSVGTNTAAANLANAVAFVIEESPLIDLIGLNCATGPTETGEHRGQPLQRSTTAFVAHHPEAKYFNA